MRICSRGGVEPSWRNDTFRRQTDIIRACSEFVAWCAMNSLRGLPSGSERNFEWPSAPIGNQRRLQLSPSEQRSAASAVQVLLATYNGERFLREQIDSILRQTYPHVGILARDDGSTDGTLGILTEYAHQLPERFRVVQGPPTGNAKWNFLHLLEASTADYLAFADQDDVWTTGKIELEMEAMNRLQHAHGSASPLLVFSDLSVVDEKLNTLNPSFWSDQGIRPENLRRLERLLMQNVVTGCTILLNRPLAQLMLPMPAQAHMHDWWVALIASVFGHAESLTTPTVLYRQHDRNVFGASRPANQRFVPKWRLHNGRRKSWELSVGMAVALLQAHGGSLSADQRKTFEALLRCETHPNRLVRAMTWLRHGFFIAGRLRPNAGLLWYLWDADAARKEG